MSSQNKLIPQLRFPEFEGDGEWVEKVFQQLFVRLTNKNEENNQNVLTISAQLGLVSQLDYFNKKVSAKDVSGYYLLRKGDFAYNKSYSKDYPMGAIKQLKYYDKGVVSTLYICFRTKDGYNPSFFKQYFDSGLLNSEIANIAQEGGRAHGLLNVSVKEFFKDIKLVVPGTQEQQKIASCLSSLDELIVAHNDKLDALKDHKKGLLQNLFPSSLNHDSKGFKDDHDFKSEKKSSNQVNQKNQGSDNAPNLRFPEFEDDGAWLEKKLGQIGDPLMCKRVFKDQTTSNPENGIPFYKIGTFGKEPDSYISSKLYEEFKSKYNFPGKGDILISASGTIGRLVVYDGEPAYFQDSNIVWLEHSEKEVSNDFLYYCYSIVNWQTSDGGVIKRLYNSDLKAISIKFPENESEQRKIATCLTSVDDLITAQQEKIEELLQHKKGLMQGLFPRIHT